MTSVQLQKIDLSFGPAPVLRGLDFLAESGQYVVLLGESGGGKTTTLRIIAGLQQPDAGTVLLGGRDVSALPPRSRDLAMVFQQDALYPHLTVAGSIRFALKGRVKPTEIEQRVASAAELTGIQSLLDRYPHHLSGGQLRRAAIAKAIARQSGVRLLDEPLASLDGQARESLQQDIVRWHRSLGGTTIHVTHDGQEAMRMADVIAVLSEGQVDQCDTPNNVFEQPATLAVARSIGSPTIQCFDAEVRDGKCKLLHHDSAECRFTIDRSDGECILAIRPESFQVKCVESPQRDFSLSGSLQRCDHVNGALHLSVQCGLQMVVAVASADTPVPAVGDRIWLTADRGDVHVFGERSD